MRILKKASIKLFIFLFFIAMLLFPIPTLNGASNGLLLWFQTILPTLLPFIMISNMMIQLNITDYICKLFRPIFTKFFGISTAGCYPVLIGFISGFPMGAKASADMVSLKKITLKEGQFLISLCNNASIMFITSYIAVNSLNQPSLRYVILFILYLSAILSAFLGRWFFHLKDTSAVKLPEVSRKKLSFRFHDSIDTSIMDGFEVITKVGGYIILFSILGQMILSVGMNHSSLFYYFKLFAVGILEITSGTHIIGSSLLPFPLKFILICTIIAFGGLSSLAQTYSVIAESGLSIKIYLKTKIMNAVIAFIISTIYVIVTTILFV